MGKQRSRRARLTRELAREQKWKCYYCEQRMAKDLQEANNVLSRVSTTEKTRRLAAAWRVVTYEHLKPVSKGGEVSEENGAAACAWCNGFRGKFDESVAKRLIMYLVGHNLHPHQTFIKTGLLVTPHPSIRGMIKIAEENLECK